MILPKAVWGTSRTSVAGSQSVARLSRTHLANSICSGEPRRSKLTAVWGQGPPGACITWTWAPDFSLAWYEKGEKQHNKQSHLLSILNLVTQHSITIFIFWSHVHPIENLLVASKRDLWPILLSYLLPPYLSFTYTFLPRPATGF